MDDDEAFQQRMQAAMSGFTGQCIVMFRHWLQHENGIEITGIDVAAEPGFVTIRLKDGSTRCYGHDADLPPPMLECCYLTIAANLGALAVVTH